MKGGYVELAVLLECLTLIIDFYGGFIAILGILGHLLVFLFLSCVLFGILLRFRIPKPKDSNVQSIFGSEWGSYSTKKDDEKDEPEFIINVVAHRACGLDAPENSLSALEMIKKANIKVVEFDVLLTSDDVPVVFHDDNLYRMTDVNKCVRDATYEEIKMLDISLKHPFGKNFRDERIPTLEEYVTYCLKNDIRMIIDLKNPENKTVEVINDIYKKYPKLYEMAVVSSFNPVLIYNIRAKDSNIVCSLAWRPYFYSHEEYGEDLVPKNPRTSNLFHLFCLRILNKIHQWALWKFGYYLLGLSAVLLHKDMITREIINYWNKRGIRVVAWTVNLPTEKRYFEKILEITYLTDTVINS